MRVPVASYVWGRPHPSKGTLFCKHHEIMGNFTLPFRALGSPASWLFCQNSVWVLWGRPGLILDISCFHSVHWTAKILADFIFFSPRPRISQDPTPLLLLRKHLTLERLALIWNSSLPRSHCIPPLCFISSMLLVIDPLFFLVAILPQNRNPLILWIINLDMVPVITYQLQITFLIMGSNIRTKPQFSLSFVLELQLGGNLE